MIKFLFITVNRRRDVEQVGTAHGFLPLQTGPIDATQADTVGEIFMICMICTGEDMQQGETTQRG